MDSESGSDLPALRKQASDTAPILTLGGLGWGHGPECEQHRPLQPGWAEASARAPGGARRAVVWWLSQNQALIHKAIASCDTSYEKGAGVARDSHAGQPSALFLGHQLIGDAGPTPDTGLTPVRHGRSARQPATCSTPTRCSEICFVLIPATETTWKLLLR